MQRYGVSQTSGIMFSNAVSLSEAQSDNGRGLYGVTKLLYLGGEWTIVNAVMTAQPGSREDKREIDERALRQFLQWLSEDSSIAGKEYLRIRQLLVTYFTRKACDDPDRLA